MPRTKTPGVGHNGPTSLDDSELKTLLADVLPRIESLLAEKESLQDDIKDLFLEAKSRGANTQALRKAIAQRRAEREKGEAAREVQIEMDRYLEIAKNL